MSLNFLTCAFWDPDCLAGKRACEGRHWSWHVSSWWKQENMPEMMDMTVPPPACVLHFALPRHWAVCFAVSRACGFPFWQCLTAVGLFLVWRYFLFLILISVASFFHFLIHLFVLYHYEMKMKRSKHVHTSFQLNIQILASRKAKVAHAISSRTALIWLGSVEWRWHKQRHLTLQLQ